MFDIGFLELLVIAVIALIVLGPERLPVAIKVVAVWIGRLRRSFQSIRQEIEKEINADEIRREIHNESVMAELKKTRDSLQKEVDGLNQQIDAVAESSPPSEHRQTTASNNTPGQPSSGSSSKTDP
ncbi:MAG: twin arginine-targeting protein translocase TatB [Oceanospirillales bacterium LUC14_002_19_P2]|nr:MAG: twin arginine-targeting protein translocase TatB [Oceanospirillales bacterium LUC14_002_19_P2]